MKIVEDRRALHQIPELDRELPQTLAYIRQALEGLNCQVFSPMAGSLCAFFNFGAAKAIAFRADSDALPIQEQSQAPYASRHPGRMHACGHDGHMAIALELARRLDRKENLGANVLIVFQPAEETTGGARDLCDTGIFEIYGVEAIFGLHLWPGLDKGAAYSRQGAMMSRSCEVDVIVTGRSAHIARAREGLDALAAAVKIYDLASDLERTVEPESFKILRFGRLDGGTVRNAVAGEARLLGTLRAFRDPVFFRLQEELTQICQDVAQQTGCFVDMRMSEGYPAVWNPDALYDRVRELVPFRILEEPSLTTEDFSWYQQRLPGMFFFLGIGDAPALHSDGFDFDESVLTAGADLFEKLAEAWI